YRDLDPEGSDPSLFREDLAGGFLCSVGGNPAAAEHRCRFRFLTPALFPFMFSPELEALYRSQGKVERLEKYQAEPLAAGVWYPVELRVDDREVGFGVLDLAEAVGPGNQAAGRLRFAYEGEWDPAVRRVQLHRDGRAVGEAEWEASS